MRLGVALAFLATLAHIRRVSCFHAGIDADQAGPRIGLVYLDPNHILERDSRHAPQQPTVHQPATVTLGLQIGRRTADGKGMNSLDLESVNIRQFLRKSTRMLAHLNVGARVPCVLFDQGARFEPRAVFADADVRRVTALFAPDHFVGTEARPMSNDSNFGRVVEGSGTVRRDGAWSVGDAVAVVLRSSRTAMSVRVKEFRPGFCDGR